MNDENSANAEENQNTVVPVTDGEVPGSSSVQTVTAMVKKTVEVRPTDQSVEEVMIVTVAEVNEVVNRLDTVDTVGECSVHCESVMLSELDNCTLKTPQKQTVEPHPLDK